MSEMCLNTEYTFFKKWYIGNSQLIKELKQAASLSIKEISVLIVKMVAGGF
jgi:hypothetical protein